MKLEIRHTIVPINVFCGPIPTEIFSVKDDRIVLIDGKEVPPGLAYIILAGVDVMTHHYLDQIEVIARLEGHKL